MHQQKIVIEERKTVVKLTNSLVGIEYDLSSGKWSFYKEDGKIKIYSAFTSIDTSKGTFRTCDHYFRSWNMNRISDDLGKGMEVKFICKSEVNLPVLITVITLYENKSFITIRAELINTLKCELKIADIYPLRVSSDQGGEVYFSDKINTYQVLISGPYSLSKKYCLVSPGALKNIEEGWSTECSMMNSIWNPTIKAGMLAGFLSSCQSLNRIYLSYNYRKRASSGKGSFELSARCQYSGLIPSPPNWLEESRRTTEDQNNKFRLSPSSQIYTDTVMIHFTSHPLDSLEEYGDNCALVNKVKFPQQIPGGWCSWYELGSNINEEIILKNLDYVAQNLLPYGVIYFQIDDGWQICNGDWVPHPKKFPRGMKWLADRIHSQGLKAGIWVAPLRVNKSSSLFQEHPDWLVKNSSGEPQEVTKGSFGLDCTLPQVQDWLRQLFTTLSKEWGYDYFKIDFLTYGIAGNNFNTKITKGRALYLALKIIKESIGKDKFLNSTGPISTGIGIVEGSRLGYDVYACWEGAAYWGMGIKPCVRAAAINYYLHNRVFKNDPDCLVIRSPELNLDQAKAWASLIALSGGIILLSDDLTKLTPERVEIATKVLPSYGKSARPLDLFEYEYPKIWHLSVKKSFSSWDVLGVFNWGYARDNIEVSFEDLGLDPKQNFLIYDFWSERFLGKFTEKILLSLIPTSCRVLAIHKEELHPQVIGTDTHITCGGVDLEDVQWNNTTRRLSGKLKGIAKRSSSLYIFVPNNYQLISVGVNSRIYSVSKTENLVKLTFDCEADGWVEWELIFCLIMPEKAIKSK